MDSQQSQCLRRSPFPPNEVPLCKYLNPYPFWRFLITSCRPRNSIATTCSSPNYSNLLFINYIPRWLLGSLCFAIFLFASYLNYLFSLQRILFTNVQRFVCSFTLVLNIVPLQNREGNPYTHSRIHTKRGFRIHLNIVIIKPDTSFITTA